MARLVVGRHYWQRATVDQRHAFIHEFTRLVVRTYAVALASYNQQQVKFLPLREQVANQRRLQINTLVIKPGAPSIPVTYRLVKRGNVWKIYDFSVDGVSFIHNYRSQFSGVLASGGFAGLLAQFASHNKEA
jgi:phospholipid transport system substrate-binding protein